MSISYRLKRLTLASIVLSLTCSIALTANELVVKETLAQAATTPDRKAEADQLFQEGVQQYRRGQYPKALQTYQRVLEIRQQLNDKAGIGQTLNNMGEVYLGLAQADKASEVLQQALAIRQELKDRKGEGETLNNLGSVYNLKSQYDKALETLQQALAISREVKDRAGEGRTLRKLGVTYYYLKQNPKALEILNQSLAIQEEIRDKFQAGYTLFGIASVYQDLEDYPRMLEWCEKALATNREVGNRFLEGTTLVQIGFIYSVQNKYDHALESFQQALAIRREINDKPAELKSLILLSSTYISTAISSVVRGLYSQAKAEYSRSIEVAQEALTLARELKNQNSEAEALIYLGTAYSFFQDDLKAIEVLQQALSIAREIKDLDIEYSALTQLGGLYTLRADYRQVIEIRLRQLEIARQQNNKWGEADILLTIASSYNSIGEHQKAVETHQQALAAAQQIEIAKLPPTLQDNALRTESNALSGLSLSYSQLGEYDKAIDWAQQLLNRARTLRKPELEANALLKLANLYNIYLNDAPKALEVSQQALTIARQIKEPRLEAEALESSSSAYNKQANYTLALQSAEQYLTIAKQLENPELEQNALNVLVQIYSNQGNYQKALEFARARLAVLQRAKLNGYEINALTFLSQSYGLLGDTTKAVEISKQALNLARQRQNPSSEALALNILSEAYRVQGEYEQGIEVAQMSLEISRKNKYFIGEVAAAANLSAIYQVLGEYQKVIAVAEPGLAQAKKINNRDKEASLLMNLGDAYQVVGNYNKGKEFIEQSLAIARELKNPGLESQALAYLGNLYNNSNDFQKALELSQQSLKIATELKSPSLQSIPQFNLGHIYRNLGDYQKSREYYQQALATMRQLKNRQGEGNALLNLASLAAPQQTVELAQQALTIFQEIKVPGLEVFATRMLSVGYAALGNDAKAIESAQAFLTFARKTQNPAWEKSALNLLGNLHRKFGRKEPAIAAYQQALAIPTPTEVAGSKYYSLYGLASIYRDLNQPGVAITYYKQSINGIEEIRRNIQGLPPELQNSFLQATVDFNNVKTADVYRQLADLLLSQGRDKEAQQVLELLKVQEIRDVARGGGTAGEKPNVPLNQTETKIPAASESLIALGRQISECDRTNCNQKSVLNDKLTALVEQFNQDLQKIEQDIRANRATDDVFFDPQKLAKAREIVKAQPGTVMIYPLVLENKLWLLMYSEGDVVKKFEVNVGRQELGETVVKFRKLIENERSDINEVQKTGKQLYDWLVKPIEPELKANSIKHLVFSLDRVTRYIPMSALFDGKQYLIENYILYNVLSADLTNMGDKLPVGTQNTPVLAMGLSNAVPGFNPLPNVPAELDAIVRKKTNDTQGIYPGEEYLNRTFDFRSLRDNLTGHKILHLATHGVFVPGSSNQSYIVLGTGEQLTIPKINALTGLSNIHLVVLSACETALAGPRQDGVEIASVAYYFLNGGAKAVMASLWLVNDASTSLLMEQFYKNLGSSTSEKPMTKAESLRQAQLSLLQGKVTAKDAPQRGGLGVAPRPGAQTTAVNSNSLQFSHPYYWAPFILIGNGL